jgi:ketosteroid isomerase-like protein
MESGVGAHALDITVTRHDTVAARADSLVLTYQQAGNESFQDEYLMLLQFDDSDRSLLAIQFAVDDIASAMAELDHLALATSEPENRASRHAQEGRRRVFAGDYESTLETTSADIIVEDKRTARAVTFDSDQNLENVRAITESGFTRVEDKVLAVRGDHAALLWLRCVAEASDFFDDLLIVHIIDGEGLGIHLVMFDPDAVEEATAELDQLAARYAPAASELANRATAGFDAYDRAFARRDWDALSRLFNETHELIDRRRMVGGTTLDRDGTIAGARSIADLGFNEITTRVIAVRGDNLALVEKHYMGGGNHVEALEVGEVDADGRFVHDSVFDVDDIDAAIAGLDRRIEDWAAVLKVTAAFELAFNQADWSAIGALLTPDVVELDHRPLTSGEVRGAALSLAHLETFPDVVPDHVVFARRILALTDDAALALVRGQPRHGRGHGMEDEVLVIFVADTGKLNRIELIDIANEAFARQRFAELTSTKDGADLRNRATAAFFAGARMAADGREAELQVSDSFRYLDHRPGLGVDVSGSDTDGVVRGQFSAKRTDSRVLAIRGKSLALLGGPYGFVDSDFVSESYSVLSVDDRGVADASIVFGPDQLADAISELDDRANSPATTAFDRAAPELLGAETGDLAYARQVLAERGDVALVQFRVQRGSKGTARDGFSIIVATNDEVTHHEVVDGDESEARTAFEAFRENGARLENAATRQLEHDFPENSIEVLATRGEYFSMCAMTSRASADTSVLTVHAIDSAQQITHLAEYDVDDFATALIDLHNLYAATLPETIQANLSVQVRFVAAYSANDIDEVARCLTDSFVQIDHSPAAYAPMDRAAFLANYAQGFDRDQSFVVYAEEALAVHELGNVTRILEIETNEAGGRVEWRTVGVTMMKDGRIDRIEYFPGDQTEAALSRFNELLT